MIHYIPFLKAKRGELTAVGDLPPEVKQAMRPFFDFPRKNEGYNPKAYAKKAHQIATAIKKHWGADAGFYFDDFDIAQKLTVEGEHQYAFALRALQGLQVIPVVALDRTSHNDAVVQLKRAGEIASSVVALRVEGRDFEDFEAREDDIDYDLAGTFGEFEAIDLILDCRLCTSTEQAGNVRRSGPVGMTSPGGRGALPGFKQEV